MADRNMIFPIVLGIDERLPFYAAGVGVDYIQEDVLRPCGSSQYQWVQCREGQGELFLGDEHYTVSPGQGILFFPGEPHSYHRTQGVWKTDWVIFGGSGIESFFTETMNLRGSGLYQVSDPLKMVGRIDRLYRAESGSAASAAQCSAMTYEVMLGIMTLASSDGNASIDEKFKKLEPVISFINENYGRALSLEELASIADVTPQYLCRIFKTFTSRTVFEYINLTRVRHSKELLMCDPDLLIKEVALMCGFSGESYFCSMFRRYEGMSPMEFRSGQDRATV